MRFLGITTVTAGFVAVALVAPAQAQRDPVFCYQAKQSKGFERFGKTPATKKFYSRINDVIDPVNPQGLVPGEVPGVDFTYQIKKVRDLCVTADVGAAGVSAPDAAWLSYQIKQDKGSCDGDPAVPCKKDSDCQEAGAGVQCTVYKFEDPRRFEKKDPTNLAVRVADAYSEIRLDFAKEAFVFSPASVDDAGFQGVPAGEETFKCYAVKPTKSVCVADAPQNPLQACKKEEDCGGVKKVTEYCERQLKFPKQTHPDGLSVSLETPFQAVLDPLDPPKTFELRKMRTFCQAAETKLVGDAVSPVNEPQAGLLCYQVKMANARCAPDSPSNPLGACKREDHCGGVHRVTSFCEKKVDPKFDKKNVAVQQLYAEDSFFPAQPPQSPGHRFDLNKENVLCTPACRAVEDFELNDLVSHITHLALGPNGAHPALAGLPRGVDVDANGATEAPLGFGDGIDNQLQGLGGILNGLLQEELDSGGFSLLFQASDLANGAVTISGFTGDLDAAPGCAIGVEPNPIDPGDPGDPCHYTANRSSFTWDVAGDCNPQALIELDVNVSGAESVPTADAIGGGPGNNFTLSIPFGEQSFSVMAENVRVEAEITHDGVGIDEIRGVLGGGVHHQTLVDTVAALPNSCNGGANDGNACNDGSDCPGGGCELLQGFLAQDLADFIGGAFPPDLDLDGDTVPESVSIGLLFRATKAVATGLD